jgi:RNA polymerase sigma-70 factor (ECF subfamily)
VADQDLVQFIFDHYRKKRKWISTEEGYIGEKGTVGDWETIPAENLDPEGHALTSERNAKIADAIRKLPEDFRATIVLVDMGDFSYAEAAEILSCPVGTIRSRISRSRKLLHKYLNSYVGAKVDNR